MAIMTRTKSISMKKLYIWAGEYPTWKWGKANPDQKETSAMKDKIETIADFLKMVWEKRNL